MCCPRPDRVGMFTISWDWWKVNVNWCHWWRAKRTEDPGPNPEAPPLIYLLYHYSREDTKLNYLNASSLTLTRLYNLFLEYYTSGTRNSEITNGESAYSKFSNHPVNFSFLYGVRMFTICVWNLGNIARI